MMDWAPWARIGIRYAVGAIIGADQAGLLAADPDLITVVALGIGAVVEGLYAAAKRKGWAT
jgi:hypothetical protein